MPSSSAPSPMALSRSSSPSIFNRKKSPIPSAAASYLSAVSQEDARRARVNVSRRVPSATPPLSLSSTSTSSSEDTILYEHDINGHGNGNADFDDNYDGLAFPSEPPTSEQIFTTLHTEFGHCANEKYRHTSQHVPGTALKNAEEQDPPYYILLSTYVSYLILIVLGHIRDFVGKRLNPASYKHLMPHGGYAALNSDFDSFYTRRLKLRMDDCFSQPVTGVAGRTIALLDRFSPDHNRTLLLTGTRTRALNISSYNYLGFAQARGGCADAVAEAIRRYGVSTCGPRLEGGSSELHQVAERLVAKFVGMEDSLISSMGFATNSTLIPALVGRGSLVISDELNHASIRFGVRLSGAQVRIFKHNDMESLEALLREVVSQGQPKTHRPWRKILLIVEGLYSMEGTLVNLPVIMELKKKYKFYLFVDEAHSIGALGPHGRGVADYFSIPPNTIDVLMGTFTKSFGAAGGYIAGSRALVDRLRVHGHAGAYAESMTPPVLVQVVASMVSIMGVGGYVDYSDMGVGVSGEGDRSRSGSLAPMDDIPYPGPAPPTLLPSWLTPTLTPQLLSGSEGQSRLRRLAFNSRYLSAGLRKLGFITYGHADAPIVPLLLFNPGKMPLFGRMMRQRRTPIVVVVVAYPATPLVTSRVRFCVSASHTKEDVDCVLRACDEVGEVLDLKHGQGERWSLERVLGSAEELVVAA